MLILLVLYFSQHLTLYKRGDRETNQPRTERPARLQTKDFRAIAG